MRSGPAIPLASRIPSITGVDTSTCVFIGRATTGPGVVPVRCTSWSELVETFGSASAGSELFASVRQFFDNGGQECWVVRVAAGADVVDASHFTGDAATGTGMHAIPAALIFGLLVVPRDDALTDTARLAVLAEASRLCERRRAFLLVDAPRYWSQAGQVTIGEGDVASLRAALAAEHAAVYYPDVRSPDGTSWVGAAGAVAGIMARLDRKRGVWQSAAGSDALLAGNPDLGVAITNLQGDRLNPLGVNVLRRISGRVVVWGARTLAGADGVSSEWKYVAVRRFGLFLERSLEQGLAWTRYEPNGEELWRAVDAAAENFLLELFRAGAFPGAMPRDAYFAKCDATTMTTADVEAGRVQLMVGFAPVRPAEFIILRITLPTAAQGVERASQAAAALRAGRLVPAARRRRRTRLSDTVLLSGAAERRLLAAEAIAARLQRRVQRVDLSSVVSRYIGETEKNLARLLDRAEQAGTLLFLDEGDELFGQRTDVKDAHDRYANVELSALLDRIRARDGVALVGLASRTRVAAPVRAKARCVIEVD